MSAPTRLLEDSSVSQKMRDDLRRTQGAVILPFDTAAGLARLRAGLEAGATLAPPAAVGGGLLGGAGWKVLGALGVTGLVGWALLDSSGSDPREVQPPAPRAIAGLEGQPITPSEETVAPTELAVPVEDASAVVEPEPSPAPATPAPPSAKNVAPSGVVAAEKKKADPFADEIAHLASLRQLHQTDPASAIVAARKGHQEFSGGVLYEEREALLILSLQKVDRGAEASQRIETFRARFPRSAFLSKMGAPTSTREKGAVKDEP